MRTATIKRILLVTFNATNGWDGGVNTDEALCPPPRTALECLANIAARPSPVAASEPLARSAARFSR
jgi:hypothetical protein